MSHSDRAEIEESVSKLKNAIMKQKQKGGPVKVSIPLSYMNTPTYKKNVSKYLSD